MSMAFKRVIRWIIGQVVYTTIDWSALSFWDRHFVIGTGVISACSGCCGSWIFETEKASRHQADSV